MIMIIINILIMKIWRGVKHLRKFKIDDKEL